MDFYVPKNFGTPGAILVFNGHNNLDVPILSTITTEFKITDAHVVMPDKNVIGFFCNSWVFASDMDKDGRLFFANKVIYRRSISLQMVA